MHRISGVRFLVALLLVLAASHVMAADYPALLATEVALYPQARVDSVEEYAGGASAVIATSGTVDEAVRYYREKLIAKGWSVTADMTLGTALALEFQRGSSNISINIMPAPGGAMVVLTINQ